MSTHLKIASLRNKGTPDIEALKKKLREQKSDLLALRVQKNGNNAAATKVAKIRLIRKNIARILTVLSQTQRDAVRATYSAAKQRSVRKAMPKSLKPKLTHRRRLALTKKEKSFKTARAVKTAARFPLRKFAVKL